MELSEELEALKKKRDAVILAHYYTRGEVQELADYVGDSFYLSRIAAGLTCRTIVFAGVRFMGECAKLLNPSKTVLMPDSRADCFMAHMMDNTYIKKMRNTYDDLIVMCYVNSTTETKSMSDVCCTSSNAVAIARKLQTQHILFIPDRNLGHFVAKQVPEKKFFFNDGFCPIHEYMDAEDLKQLQTEHPGAPILAHPECPESIRLTADYVGSTSGILKRAETGPEAEYIIATERGVLHQLQKRSPNKKFFFAGYAPSCMNMKMNTPEKILHVLRTGEHSVSIPEKLQNNARQTLIRMLELTDQEANS